MSEMVERVARAICEKAYGPDAWGAGHQGWREHSMNAARAAIEAMREPTKEMIYEGNSKVDDCIDFWNYDSGAGYSVEPHAARDTWQGMIDEALK